MSNADPNVANAYRSLLGKHASGDADGLDRSLAATWGIVPPMEKQKRKKTPKTIAWPKRHSKLFAQRGEDWAGCQTEPSDDVKRLFPGLFAIQPREFDRLYLGGVSFPESKMRIIEVGQSAGRSSAESEVTDCMGTVIPNGRYYVTHRCRLLLGVEMMHLQSLWFPQEVEASTPDSTLRSLAGNAFEVSCASAACLCALLLLANQSRYSKPGPPHEPREASLQDTDSDEGDDDLDSLWRRRKALI